MFNNGILSAVGSLSKYYQHMDRYGHNQPLFKLFRVNGLQINVINNRQIKLKSDAIG